MLDIPSTAGCTGGVALETRCLSFHGGYACRHRGVCCSSNWPIPVEADRLARLELALAAGRVVTRRHVRPLVHLADAPADAPALLARVGGRCVFFEGPGSPACRIHRALGHDALPLACRQFPRVSVVDPRGVSVTLSNYCPTAAERLTSASSPTTIDLNAPAFPPGGEYVGLDVRDRLPPLLRPDVLMDWESWWRWEELATTALANAGDARVGLARVRAAVFRARQWRPGNGELIAWIDSAFESERGVTRVEPLSDSPEAEADDILDAVPAEWRHAVLAPDAGFDPAARWIGKFLAAHAFANWTAHLGQGLASWLASIEGAVALVALGHHPAGADLILRHLADPPRLAAIWSRRERA